MVSYQWRRNGVGRVSKVQGAECKGSRVPAKQFFTNNFPVTLKIRTSGYQTLERFYCNTPNFKSQSYSLIISFVAIYLSTILGCELHKNCR